MNVEYLLIYIAFVQVLSSTLFPRFSLYTLGDLLYLCNWCFEPGQGLMDMIAGIACQQTIKKVFTRSFHCELFVKTDQHSVSHGKCYGCVTIIRICVHNTVLLKTKPIIYMPHQFCKVAIPITPCFVRCNQEKKLLFSAILHDRQHETSAFVRIDDHRCCGDRLRVRIL